MIRDNEVIFREPSTGEKWTLTPERVISLQFQLGSRHRGLPGRLHRCGRSRSPSRSARSSGRCGGRAAAARSSTVRLAQRGGAGHRGSSPWSRAAASRRCAASARRALVEIGFDGYGFGGWPLAADGSLLADPLRWVAESLPATAPKHALGIGRPDHVVSAFALGYSIFDCALPTRDARHGRLYAFRAGWTERRPSPGDDFYRAVRIHDPEYRVDHGPIEEGCDCPVCARHSAAYLHHLFKVGDTSAERLATLHNLRFYVRLFALLREPQPPLAAVRGGLGGVLAAERVGVHAPRSRKPLGEQLERDGRR